MLEFSCCDDNYYCHCPAGKAGLLRSSVVRGLPVICTGLTGSDSVGICLIIWPGTPLELLCRVAAPIYGGDLGVS